MPLHIIESYYTVPHTQVHYIVVHRTHGESFKETRLNYTYYTQYETDLSKKCPLHLTNPIRCAVIFFNLFIFL